MSQRHSDNDEEANGFDLPRFVVNEYILIIHYLHVVLSERPRREFLQKITIYGEK